MLRVARIGWNDENGKSLVAFRMTLSDDSSVKAGKQRNSKSHIFSENDRVTKIEVYHKQGTRQIERLAFYQADKILVDTNPKALGKGGIDTFFIDL
jgi:hypothetical protein